MSHTYDNEGSYIVTLTVTDADGLTDTASVVVNVGADNTPPTACFTVTPTEGSVGITEFTFDASCSSDPDGTITNYEWDFENDGIFDVSGPTKITVTHTYTNKPLSGSVNFIVKLRVTDSGQEGLPPSKAETTKTINVVNNPPVVNIIAQPTSGAIPLEVNFGADVTDADGHNIDSYTWNFGDGTPVQSGKNVSHTFNSEGSFTVTLTAIDEYGASASNSVTINVLQSRAITALRAYDVIVGSATEIFVNCSNASDTVELEVLKQNEQTGTFEPVAGGSSIVACGSTTNYTPTEAGVYKVIASIVGCGTRECVRATLFQAKQKMLGVKTPEISPALALGIVLVIVAIIRVKK